MQEDSGRNIAGSVLIGLGGLFLLAQFTGMNIMAIGWPLFVLIPGLVFLMLALRGNEIGFIFPGVIVTGTGAILAYQNFTGHWESWAYIWTLYPVFVGTALRYAAHRTNKPQEAEIGRNMMVGGLIGFVALGGLFELFIFGGMEMSLPITPIIMIGAGIFLLLRGNMQSKQKRKSHDI